MKQIGPRQTPGPDCVQGGCAAQPHRAGRARRTGRNWCDAAAPTAIRHAPRDGLQPRSGTVPPATAYRPRPGAAPPATAPRPRSGAVPPRRRIGIGLVPRPPRQRFDPALGATTFALTPRSGAVPPLGTTTLALGPRLSPWGHDPRSGVAPPVLGGFPAAMPRPTLPWGPRSSPGGCAMRKPSVLVAGGQNRRFFAVSEVGNGRFCRLFA